MAELAIAELTPTERRRLAREHPEISGDQPAWIVSSDALAQIRTLVGALVETEADFQSVVEAMIPRIEVPAPAVVLQARRNAEARDALIREFGLLTSADVADLAGSTAKNRAALAKRWKQEGKIFSVPLRGSGSLLVRLVELLFDGQPDARAPRCGSKIEAGRRGRFH